MSRFKRKVENPNTKYKGYVVRLYPTEEQATMIKKTIGSARKIYNLLLQDTKEQYEKDKTFLLLHRGYTYYKDPSNWKAGEDYSYLSEVDSHALNQAQQNLFQAYQNFFAKRAGFPTFKRKADPKQSYVTKCINNNIRIEFKINENGKKTYYLRLPKIGFVKIKMSKEIPESYKIKSVTVTKTSTDKYYASIMLEYETEPQKVELDPNNSIGLDMDMKNLCTDDQGNRAIYPKFYKLTQEKLARKQRQMSKMQKGSKNRQKQRIKVAKIHEKIANQRKDFLHKLSKDLADTYDIVVIEDLDLQTMSQSLNLGKSVYDNGWGMFTAFLKYKLEDRGKKLIKIDRWFPSSKTCNVCGYKYDGLTLADRLWECPQCHTIHDRDVNAAINIRNEGLRIYFESTNRRADGVSSLILVGTNTTLSEKPSNY